MSHFSTLRTKISDAVVLKTALSDLGLEVKNLICNVYRA